jgi:iron complex outermembrane receptor protein
VDTSGNPGIRPERMLATEAGARWQPSTRISLDLAAFHNLYRDLQSIEAGAPRFETTPMPRMVLPLWFANGLEGRTFGTELAATFQALPRWRLMTSYSWLRARLRRKPGSTAVYASELAGEASEHQGTLRSWLDVSRKVSFDATLYLTDRLPAQSVAGYVRMDARLAWRPVKPLELSLTGQNLGGRRRAEFIPLQDRVFHTGELGRAAYVRVVWRF